MTEYKIKKIGDVWYISKITADKIICSSYDYEIVKHAYYGPRLKKSLKTCANMLDKTKNSLDNQEGIQLIDSLVNEVKLLLALLDRKEEVDFGV